MTKTLTRAKNVPAPSHLDCRNDAAWVGLRPLMQVDDVCVYAVTSLERWEVFVDSLAQRVFVSQETWDTLAWDDEAQQQFEDTYVADEAVSDGMHFICQDAGPIARAAKAEAAAAGTDKPAEKDRLVQLAEKATGLIIQAASLNTQATPGQTTTFSVRYARLQEELDRLKAELATVQGLVDLAGTAVADAT